MPSLSIKLDSSITTRTRYEIKIYGLVNATNEDLLDWENPDTYRDAVKRAKHISLGEYANRRVTCAVVEKFIDYCYPGGDIAESDSVWIEEYRNGKKIGRF